ncbi:ATP-grasp domain-containing protein [Nocardia blacklockiae]|uniref:ATP-grasp domain-containing protein n=1 Tax=Nocardia blacklockiae TaxID=480036 RepID=UPI0018935630|nr:ATP-grasp domain-containing protein [Nocardia blacklockiae]MBF6170712.1 ATP-grasp domain-containing protein [Nocardia blacklockiae]
MILDPTGSDSENAVRTAVRDFGNVLVVCHTGFRAPECVDAPGVVAIGVDFADRTAALARISQAAREYRVDGAATFKEYLVPFLNRLCAALSLPGNDPSHPDAARNKVTMSERFAACGVSAPATRAVCTAGELPALLGGTLRFPVVVKPAERAGSVGVQVLRTAAELCPEPDGTPVDALSPYGFPLDNRVLVQDCVDGTEYSVESVTRDGVTRHLCITEKTTTTGAFRVETGHCAPAPVDPARERRLLAEATAAIRAVGIRNAVSHTELIVDGSGTCFVVEVAARPGASTIGVLARLATGIDLGELVIRTALGIENASPPGRREAAASRLLLPPRGGRLVAVHGMPAVGGDVRAVVHTRPPGTVLPPPTSNYARVGYFIVAGADAHAANRRADELLSQVAVEVEPC